MKTTFWIYPLALVVLAGCEREFEDPHARGRTNCKLSGRAPAEPQEQILFGDLHSHSTNSFDALVMDLPLIAGGSGRRDPAMRCQFARYCSDLDFWSINDHAEEQTVAQWQENLEAIRACNDQFRGYDHEPELVSFLGWEWTHNSDLAEDDYGHRNVVLRHTCDDEIPARPLAAPSGFADIDEETIQLFFDMATSLDPDNADIYGEVMDRFRRFKQKPACDADVDSPKLPPDCHEVASDPEELYQKLDQWGVDTLVIPHGLTWGQYHTPPATWRHQFTRRLHDPKYDRLVEVYSGHGNMEEYRSWRHVVEQPGGFLSCPEPTADLDPCCHRAGEIVRARSDACQNDPAGAECLQEVEQARQAYIQSGKKGITTVSGADPEDWLDCGQCRDCFQSAGYHRPMFSVQAALAMSDLSDPSDPWRYKFGVTGSTDSHRAGPGAGYKEFRQMSDGYGPAREELDFLVAQAGALVTVDYARQNSYFYSGGLVAVHALGSSREAIWDALQAQRTYATSGDRMLLWFDLKNGPGGQSLPMGSQVTLTQAPQFEVRVVGAFRQAPGCPDRVIQATSADFVEIVCYGECYNPTGERYSITRIEVVKITPQILADEPLDSLVKDPFLTLECDLDPQGCTKTFSDPDFVTDGRPAAYYVRAVQEPTPQFNAGNLRCTRDADGNCTQSNLCRNGYQGEGDDCLAPDEERAWSSPIYLSP